MSRMKISIKTEMNLAQRIYFEAVVLPLVLGVLDAFKEDLVDLEREDNE